MGELELIGGPEKRAIVIEPYRATWPATFEEHRRRIEDALGSVASSVDHIGSTAVPGLAAKPIID
ncbi:MAG TPA: GrpB family protein, partial [Acidimicrobiia bacterium]|nr:GrpB family protein [Acidimicrobiia bacterium]